MENDFKALLSQYRAAIEQLCNAEVALMTWDSLAADDPNVVPLLNRRESRVQALETALYNYAKQGAFRFPT